MGSTAVSTRVRSSGVDLRVLVRDGDPGRVPFLLVHGLASNARLWDGVAEVLVEAGHGSVAVDLRGHGESEVPDGGYDFATIAADLDAVVAAIVDRPVIAAGQSWGGNVAVEFAAFHPERAAGVALVDGGFIRLRDTFPIWEDAEQALRPPALDGMVWGDLERDMRAHFEAFPEVGVVAQLANFRRSDDGKAHRRLPVARHLEILRHLWEHDPDAVAASLGIPVFVIAASDGMAGKRDRVAAFLGATERGTVVWMDAHHDLHAQYPAEVAERMLGFVRDGWTEAE
jgi:pimeloyl-ACP methyl ester carboxylesterase